VLPESAQAKINEGKVRAVGPGRIGPDGNRIFLLFPFIYFLFFFWLFDLLIFIFSFFLYNRKIK
jgi:hypothetical protein